ncbi:type II toxin-antitoxin system RnlB family antitoxin [Ureaplasma ceti]|uniref:Uncharacterized protein n=1 Tax=Ureaplasma ceti TaxID=3119530 RepID=A0ABP9U4X5_9BACT
MKEFIVLDVDSTECDKLILFLTYEGIFKHIKKIEHFLKKQSNVQTVLLDQLFITGNGYNRFIKCNYVNGKLDFTQAYHVKPSLEIKNVTIQWLHNNYELVQNSILTDSQRQNIKDNVVF